MGTALHSVGWLHGFKGLRPRWEWAGKPDQDAMGKMAVLCRVSSVSSVMPEWAQDHDYQALASLRLHGTGLLDEAMHAQHCVVFDVLTAVTAVGAAAIFAGAVMHVPGLVVGGVAAMGTMMLMLRPWAWNRVLPWLPGPAKTERLLPLPWTSLVTGHDHAPAADTPYLLMPLRRAVTAAGKDAAARALVLTDEDNMRLGQLVRAYLAPDACGRAAWIPSWSDGDTVLVSRAVKAFCESAPFGACPLTQE